MIPAHIPCSNGCGEAEETPVLILMQPKRLSHIFFFNFVAVEVSFFLFFFLYMYMTLFFFFFFIGGRGYWYICI